MSENPTKTDSEREADIRRDGEATRRMNDIRSELRMRNVLSAAQVHERWRNLGVTADDLERVGRNNTQHAAAIADIRMQLARNDLLNIDLFSPAEMHERWRSLGTTSAELQRARREAAAVIHPDRRPGDAAAAHRLARANSVIDAALADIRRDGEAITHEAAIQ